MLLVPIYNVFVVVSTKQFPSSKKVGFSSDTVMESRFIGSVKIRLSIIPSEKDLPRLIDVKAVQPANAEGAIVFTLSPITSSLREEHPLKAYWPIVPMFFPIYSSNRFVQF